MPVETAGAPRAAAEAAVVALHGRGATASGVLDLADDLHHHGVTVVAPQAARGTWDRAAAVTGTAARERWRASALDHVGAALDVAADAGVPPSRTLLFGFSQGAALACEFVLARPRRYGGVAALAGALPAGARPSAGEGSLDGTPVFLGSGTADTTVDPAAVRETANVLEARGASVATRREDGLGHAVSAAQLATVREMVRSLTP